MHFCTYWVLPSSCEEHGEGTACVLLLAFVWWLLVWLRIGSHTRSKQENFCVDYSKGVNREKLWIVLKESGVSRLS